MVIMLTLRRYAPRLMWLLNRRCGAVLFVIILIFTLRQILFQMEFDKDNERLSERRGHMGLGARINVDKSYLRPVRQSVNRTGLMVKNSKFFLDGKPFRLLGGSIHYFRFPQEYWRPRLLALKASGLNTVTTYVAWNAHEPVEGTFVFYGMLDLPKFIQIAHELELYVIVRVGPYICAEWEWGGLPSWLLRYPNMKIRTSDPTYMQHVKDWFDMLLPMIRPYQHTYGGPVIAVQVENEYGYFPNYDPEYVVQLRDIILKSGIREFLFVCDGKDDIISKKMNYGGMMRAMNFQHNPAAVFKQIKEVQPQWPLFVSEYWTGWFNWWGGPNNKLGVPWLNILDPAMFEKNTRELLDAGGHMNMYMFAGGTNFGFMNGGLVMPEEHGGNGFSTSADITSYDYDAIVTEEGLLPPKFYITRNILQSLQPETVLPDPPAEPELASYGTVRIESFISLPDLLEGFKSWMMRVPNPISMEMFPSAPDRKLGQAYGYAVYETTIEDEGLLRIDLNGKIQDRAHIYVNDEYKETVTPPAGLFSVEASEDSELSLRFLVENQGRVNWVNTEQLGIFENQRKGIVGDIKCNDEVVTGWRIWPLEFDEEFLSKLRQLVTDGKLKWRKMAVSTKITMPVLLKTSIILRSPPKDTFVELEGFEKGIVIVNGRNIGRYWNSAGPQKRLFLPGIWLNSGENKILVFEETKVGTSISFHKNNGI